MTIDRKLVESLFQRFGLGEVRTIESIETGNVNYTTKVNDTHIVRFNVRDPEIRKFDREKKAYELLSSLYNWVPASVLLDESKKLVSYDVLITSKLPGVNISSVWKDLTSEERQTLSFEAGKKLASIHSRSLDFFGSIEDMSARFGSWNEYLEDQLRKNWKEANKLGIFDSGSERATYVVFDSLKPLFTHVASAALVHGDYHFGNLLCEDGKITGVVDFEWAFAGDPESDFRSPTNIDNSAPDSALHLLEGYQSVKPLSAHFERKRDFYDLLQKLELASVSVKYWLGKKPWGESNHRRIISQFHILLGKLLTNPSWSGNA